MTITQQNLNLNTQNCLQSTLNKPDNYCNVEEKNIIASDFQIKEPQKIHVSTNYKLFVPHDLQRDLQQKNLQRLKDSVIRHDLLRDYPIKVIQTYDNVDEDHPYLVVDGNHRRKVCEELHKPIYFIIADDFEPHDVIDTGYCLARWSTPQFCDFYCKQGNQFYIKFRQFVKDYDLDMHTALPITKFPKNRKNLSEIFRNGFFTFEDEQEVRNRVFLAQEFLNKLISYSLAPKSLRDNSNFYDGFFKLMSHPKYDQKKLLDRFNNKKINTTHVPIFSKHMQFYAFFKGNFLGIKEEE